MKKMKDERLLLENLKNIRVAFLLQTAGIVGILIYEGANKGIGAIVQHPLWLLLLGTGIILLYLNMKGAADIEASTKNRNQIPYFQKIMMSLVMSVIIGLILFIAPGVSNRDGMIIGGVLFLTFVVTFTISHLLQKSRKNKGE